MSSSKAFVLSVLLRDALHDMKGLSPEACGVFTKFWFLHEMHREPLPPREEKVPVSEWDEWFRDKLDMKNVRTWRRIRDELLAKAKVRRTDDGRLYIGRTMRAVVQKRGEDPARWGGESDQSSLDLQGVHAAQLPQERVEKPVDGAGEETGSGDVRANIGQSLGDVRPILLPKSLIFHGSRPALSYSNSQSFSDVAAALMASPRARGDPASFRA